MKKQLKPENEINKLIRNKKRKETEQAKDDFFCLNAAVHDITADHIYA